MATLAIHERFVIVCLIFSGLMQFWPFASSDSISLSLNKILYLYSVIVRIILLYFLYFYAYAYKTIDLWSLAAERKFIIIQILGIDSMTRVPCDTLAREFFTTIAPEHWLMAISLHFLGFQLNMCGNIWNKMSKKTWVTRRLTQTTGSRSSFTSSE